MKADLSDGRNGPVNTFPWICAMVVQETIRLARQ